MPRPPANAKRGSVDASPFGFGVYLEQDGVLPWLSPWNEDRNYTMGLAFPIVGQWVHRQGLDIVLRGLDCLTVNRSHRAQIQAGNVMQDFGIVFGRTACTPDRLNTTLPIFDDRPYASLLFLTTMRSTINPNKRRVLRTEFTVGVLGRGGRKTPCHRAVGVFALAAGLASTHTLQWSLPRPATPAL